MIAGLGVAIVGAIVLGSPFANARPIACRIDDYDLENTGATYNDEPAPIGADGMYREDGGLTLITTPMGQVTATPVGGDACGQTARQVVVRFVDPWTGETITAALRSSP
jgi:hypothetical protein